MEAKLIDRYVREVGRRLPKKQRADVEAELHSLLMDTLQDRMAAPEMAAPQMAALETAAQETAREDATEEEQVAVLREFGPPAKVAAQYTPPHRYLIGPRFYDLYRIVVAAVAGSITLAHVVLLVLAVWGEPQPMGALATSFGEVFGGYLGAVLAGFGSVTLTFALLERTLPESAWVELEDEGEWDPRTLPEIQDSARVEVGSLVVEIVLLVIALVVFNAFPQWIGVSFVGSIAGGPRTWHMQPLLSDLFFTAYMPLLNVLWMAEIGLKVVLLRQGRWQRLTRLVELILTVFGAVILYRMAFGPPILTMQAIESASLRQLFESFLPGLLKAGLIIGFIATIGEAIHKLYLLLRGESVTLRRIGVRGPADR